MKQALIVGAGGFVGCIARYLVGVLVARLLGAPMFPYATLVVNIVGCLLIGVLGGLVQSTRVLSPELQLLLITGMLGGFTTYSTFGYQAISLLRNGHLSSALFFIGTHLVGGLGAVWLGLWLVQQR